MRGPQVAAILGGGQILSEGNRYNAIAALARAGRMPKALTGAEAEPILAGASQGARASSVSEMARYFKDDLTGQETATMLGPAAVLSEGNRYNAITALARAKRFGPSIGGDAGLALDGATQGSRAAAIGEMAPYLRTDMRGQHVAAILGSEQILSEGNRYNAIAALARAGRIPRALTAAEAELILAETTQSSRAAAISEMARYFVAGLSGDEVAAILGRNGETTEGNRYNAIAALARAGKLRAGLSGQELATVLQGMSDSSRSAAIREVASATARQIAVEPTASGTSPPKSQVPSTGEQDAGPSSPDPVLGSASLPTSTAGSTPPVLSKSIKDLPKLPLSDLRLSEYVYQFALLSQAVYQVSEIRKVDVPTRSGTETWELIGVPAIIAKGTDGLAWGFKAGVYMNRKGSTNRSVWRCAIVFAGTDDLIDMGVDIAQALGGQPPDYRVAAAFADNAIKGLCKGITTVFTGHSLGGGFAQYAYVRTGERYATFSFNTAGLAATNLDFQAANFRSGNVVNFIAQGYDPYSGRLMGRDVVSLSGVTLGRELLVPVYTWAPYTHKVAVLIEGLGIQRGYCLADPACK